MRLPTKAEFHNIWFQRTEIPGLSYDGARDYWSSEEHSSNKTYALLVNLVFQDCTGQNPKNLLSSVRCVK